MTTPWGLPIPVQNLAMLKGDGFGYRRIPNQSKDTVIMRLTNSMHWPAHQEATPHCVVPVSPAVLTGIDIYYAIGDGILSIVYSLHIEPHEGVLVAKGGMTVVLPEVGCAVEIFDRTQQERNSFDRIQSFSVVTP